MTTAAPLKIVYGVCGIGLGHAYRQLPILEYFIEQGSQLCIFAYGRSLEFYARRFEHMPAVILEQVAVPFYAGSPEGLDFKATAEHADNKGKEFLRVNCRAMEQASQHIGKPHLVISDYEPTAAQYAYAHSAPLITIDQQSKYLCRNNWPVLAGHSCVDEVMRLRMLFPKAEARIATSFFRVEEESEQHGIVALHGPVIRESILDIARQKRSYQDGNRILVYLSSQADSTQSVDELCSLVSSQSSWQFDFYVPRGKRRGISHVPENVSIQEHGDELYLESLASCSALITTAGHTLLSEAMYLEKPVLAMPLPVYEQHMNAAVLEQHGFGSAVSVLDVTTLDGFLSTIPEARDSIRRDQSVLIKTPGQDSIIETLEGLIA